MNCRRVSNRLSAYLDAEMTGEEMLAIRRHLDECPSCRAEHQSLRDTKHLLSSLALRAPASGFERHLRAEVEREASRHPLIRWMPAALNADIDTLSAWFGSRRDSGPVLPKGRSFATLAAISVAGVVFGTMLRDATPTRLFVSQTPAPAVVDGNMGTDLGLHLITVEQNPPQQQRRWPFGFGVQRRASLPIDDHAPFTSSHPQFGNPSPFSVASYYGSPGYR